VPPNSFIFGNRHHGAQGKFLGAISQTVKKIPLGVFTRSAYGFCHGALGELLAGAQQAISS